MRRKNILDIHAVAVAGLQKQGCVHDFNFYHAWKRNQLLNGLLTLIDFHVDGLPPFAGLNNPNDSAILFAIQSLHNYKGALVDTSGTYTDATMSAIVKRLTKDASTEN